MELNNRHAGSVAASSSVDRVKFLNEATVNMVLLAALEQLSNKLPIGCYLLHWRNMKTQTQH